MSKESSARSQRPTGCHQTCWSRWLRCCYPRKLSPKRSLGSADRAAENVTSRGMAKNYLEAMKRLTTKIEGTYKGPFSTRAARAAERERLLKVYEELKRRATVHTLAPETMTVEPLDPVVLANMQTLDRISQARGRGRLHTDPVAWSSLRRGEREGDSTAAMAQEVAKGRFERALDDVRRLGTQQPAAAPAPAK